jgi:hypothetical protein
MDDRKIVLIYLSKGRMGSDQCGIDDARIMAKQLSATFE